MGAWLDRLAGPLLDALIGATAWLGLIALAMVANRQPARRCALAQRGVPRGRSPSIPLVALAGRRRASTCSGSSRRSGACPPDELRKSRTARPSGGRPSRSPTWSGWGRGWRGWSLGWWGTGPDVPAFRRAVAQASRELFDELTAGLSPSTTASPAREPADCGGRVSCACWRPLIVIPPELDSTRGPRAVAARPLARAGPCPPTRPLVRPGRGRWRRPSGCPCRTCGGFALADAPRSGTASPIASRPSKASARSSSVRVLAGRPWPIRGPCDATPSQVADSPSRGDRRGCLAPLSGGS